MNCVVLKRILKGKYNEIIQLSDYSARSDHLVRRSEHPVRA